MHPSKNNFVPVSLKTLLLVLAISLVTSAKAGLIAHWPMDGNAKDVVGVWNGQMKGVTATEDRQGNVNGALAFDGVDDHITLSQPLPIGTGPMSVSLWLKIPTNADRGIIIGNYDARPNFNFELLGGTVRVYWNNGNVDLRSNQSIRDGEWHFLAMVREGEEENTKIRIYIDGFEDSTRYTGTGVQFKDPHTIGVDRRLGDEVQFEGVMDDLRIYDHVLSPDEVHILFDGTTGRINDQLDTSAFEAELLAIVRGTPAPDTGEDGNGGNPAPGNASPPPASPDTGNSSSPTSGITFTPGTFDLGKASAKRTLKGRMMADAVTGCQAWSLYDMDGVAISWLGQCIGGFATGHGVLVMHNDGDRAKALNPKCVNCGEGEIWVGTAVKGMPSGIWETLQRGYHGVTYFYPNEMQKQRIRRVGFHPEDEKRLNSYVKSVFENAQ